MKKHIFLTSTAAILIVLVCTACGGSSASEQTAAEEAVNPATGSAARPGQSTVPAVRSQPQRRLASDLRNPDTGQEYLTILTPKSQVVVLNRVPGMVTSVEVEEGDRVAEGDVLASLERDSYELRAARAAAEAERTRAIYRRNLEAFGEEARVRIVSELELDVSRAEYLQAQADSALAAKDLAYTDITAPIRGHVIERRIQSGQWLSLQEECFTIADRSTLWAVFTVPQRVAAGLAVDDPISLTVDPTGDEPFTVEGRLLLISPVVDPGGGVKITVQWNQSAGARRLLAGMTVALDLGTE